MVMVRVVIGRLQNGGGGDDGGDAFLLEWDRHCDIKNLICEWKWLSVAKVVVCDWRFDSCGGVGATVVVVE